MAALPHNIERHPTKRGAYIAYDADGCAFRVQKSTHNRWAAWPSYTAADCDPRRFHGATLAEVAGKVGASRA